MAFRIFTNKEVSALEYSSLMESIGWGFDYSEALVQRSVAAYPFVAHARSESGVLWGYVSAFSDRAFSTMLGELVVHPLVHRKGSVVLAMRAEAEPDFEIAANFGRSSVLATTLFVEACANTCLDMLALDTAFASDVDRLPTLSKFDRPLRSLDAAR